MTDIQKLTEKILKFRADRDWEQFHNPKDMALSLVLEAAEVLEHFQWKNGEEIDGHVSAARAAIGEELADVLHWVLLMAHDLDIDIAVALEEKLVKNGLKYPVEKARGRATKYNSL